MGHSKVKNSLYRNIAISFIVLSVAIAGTVFYVTFSWATIVIVPQRVPVTDEFSVTVGSSGGGELNRLAIPGRVIVIELNGDGTYNPTEKRHITRKASGTITIVNTSSQDQPLRATTRLLTKNNVLFRTGEFVSVPAGGSVDVSVVADKQGSIEQADASRLTIPGLWSGLQEKIYGTKLRIESSGDEEVFIMSQEDIDRSKALVLDKLKKKFALLMDIPDAGFRPKRPYTLIDVAEKDIKVSHKVGDETDRFTVSLAVEARGIVFDEQDIIDELKQRMQATLGPGHEFIFSQTDLIFYTLESFDTTTHEAVISARTEGAKIRSEDTSQFNRANLTGLTKEQVMQYFDVYDDIDSVNVRFYPFWVQRTPMLIDHIHILFEK
ncbi:hypothetical protein HYV71_00470 [Candidatus Uhrbacteria bacterium]|nr:hypothetical protein [Candidatus Uhrbacteria bacterium]